MSPPLARGAPSDRQVARQFFRPVDVVLYTWNACSFCERARGLLAAHGVVYREHPLEADRPLKKRLAKLFGRATMPYVLVDGEPLGGLPELEAWLAEEHG